MKPFRSAFPFMLAALLLAACSSAGLFGPTPTATFTLTPTATLTPIPTSTPTITPTPIVYDGNWYGTTSAGGRISFKIEQNAIASFKVSFSFATDNGSCDVTSETTISPA